jgi:hypothetical protein
MIRFGYGFVALGFWDIVKGGVRVGLHSYET